jgi:hypothetical protein
MWIIVFYLSNSACGFNLPTAEVTIKVIDENGIPMQGGKVEIGLTVPMGTEQGVKNTIIKGVTDSSGLYRASGHTLDHIGYSVKKEGWYESYGEYRFAKRQSGKWQPWNPEIKVVMRKIEKPVPMHARDLQMTRPGIMIPFAGKDVGFDLIEFDWVTPYGKGKRADLLFHLESTYKNKDDFDATLTIIFPNKYDGIQGIKDDRKDGSMFKLPRYAPEGGYQRSLVRKISSHDLGAPISDFSDDNNYIFRVRSEEKDGALWRAIYGKIQGDIEFYPKRQGALLLFKYFLNPDYTRNLEWSGENLFKNLKSTDQVRADN